MFKEMIRISAALSVRDRAAFLFCNVTDIEILFSSKNSLALNVVLHVTKSYNLLNISDNICNTPYKSYCNTGSGVTTQCYIHCYMNSA